MATKDMTMSPTLRLLLDHIDRIRSQHRAGENPTFGEVETLFDLAADVRAQAEREPAEWGANVPRPLTNAIERPGNAPVRLVVECDTPAAAAAVLTTLRAREAAA